jgi:hypothetical protein
MQRFYEWIKLIFQEKVNSFVKGFTGAAIVSYIFLFNSNLDSKGSIILATIIKLFAISVSGIIGGFANILGTDLYKWAKGKFTKKRITSKNKRNKKAA